MPQTTHAFDTAGFQAFLELQDEPDWLISLRQEAFDHSEAMDWPSRRHEEWLRTDIRLFQLSKFALPVGEPAPVDPPHQLLQGVDLGGKIETLDSHVLSESLDPELAEKGVVFGDLSRLAKTHPELVREHLFTAFDPDHDKFAALHAAFFAGGQFLYVPRGVVIDRPLHIGSIMTDGGTDTTHTLVVLDEGAEATVLHESNSTSRNDGGLHLGAIELIQKPGSHLRYVSLQEWGMKAFHFAQQKAIIDRDSTLQWTIAAMGSMLSKVNQSVDLVGPGADSQVNGVLFTEGRQHLAYHTQQYHRAPSC
ncbi:MAG: SufD family Fe-S cluster assembly protein, partial [Planctomycetota bacterium]